MADFAFIAAVIAFFAFAAGFVVLCDRIIGPADEAGATRRTVDSPVTGTR